MKVYNLCCDKKCCPVVEVCDSVVRIGEDGNRVELKKSEWNALVEKIKKGEIA